MIDLKTLPAWLQVDGVTFTRSELSRARPAWFWTQSWRRAWQGFRSRLTVINMLIENGDIEPKLCWAEIRLYLQSEDLAALACAKEMTQRHINSALVARLVSLRGAESHGSRALRG